MKKISVILLFFLSILIFSESREYSGTGKIIFQKFGCPNFPESSTCAVYKFISETENFIIDGSSWDLIRKANIQSGDNAELDGYINDDKNQNGLSEPLIKIIKIKKIYNNEKTL